jgi:hypothetical protein
VLQSSLFIFLSNAAATLSPLHEQDIVRILGVEVVVFAVNELLKTCYPSLESEVLGYEVEFVL